MAADAATNFLALAAARGIPAPQVENAGPVLRVTFDETALFDFDRDQARPEAAAVLDLIADSLRQDDPATQLTLLGHTDSVGSDAYNDDLARRRAAYVFQALVARGADPGRLSMVAVGRHQPIASNATPEGRARNRRVEFLFSDSLAANLALVRQRPADAALSLAVLRPIPLDGGLTLLPFTSISPAVAAPARPPVAAPARPPPTVHLAVPSAVHTAPLGAPMAY